MKLNKPALIMITLGFSLLCNQAFAGQGELKSKPLTASGGVVYSQSKVVIDGSPIETMLSNNSNQLYVGTARGRIFTYLSKTNSWQHVGGDLDHSSIYALYFNPENDLYVGTKGGHLYLLKHGQTEWQDVSFNLANKPIWSIAGDKHKLYALTQDGVVYYMSKDKWVAYPTANDSPYLYSLALGPKQHIYAGSTTGRVLQYNKSQWQEVGKPLNVRLPLWTLLFANGKIYSGDENGEVYQYTGVKNTWTPVGKPGLAKIDGSRIWQLILAQDKIYALTDKGKVYAYAKNAWTNVTYAEKSTNDTLAWSLANDKQGNVFIGTINDMVYELNAKTAKISQLGLPH